MNQPKNILTYNQESGVKAGGGEYVSEGGPYVCRITEAKFIKSKQDTSGIEFSVTTSDGLKCRFLSVYYVKKDGSAVTGGEAVLNAMMGIMGLQGITSIRRGDEYFAPEFESKVIGLFLQKKLYTKNNGSDGYEFSIRAPFNPQTSQTLKEMVKSEPAKAIERWQSSYSDVDERGKNQAASSSQSGYQDTHGNSDPFGDDIPGFDDY